MSKIPIIAFPEENVLPKLRIPTHPVVKYIRVLSRLTIIATILILVIAKYVLEPALKTTLKRRFELQNFAYSKLKQLHKRLQKTVKNPPDINVTYNGKILVDRTISSDDVIIEELKNSEFEYFKKDSKKKSHNVQFNLIESSNEKGVMFSNDTKLSDDGDTDDNLIKFSELNDNVTHSTSDLVQKLQNLKDKLSNFNVVDYKQLSNSGYNHNGNPEMNSLLYQIKQFKTYLEVMTSEHPREMLFKKPLSHIQVGGAATRIYKFSYLDILNDNLNEIKSKIDSKKYD
jgi:hypothetical protein